MGRVVQLRVRRGLVGPAGPGGVVTTVNGKTGSSITLGSADISGLDTSLAAKALKTDSVVAASASTSAVKALAVKDAGGNNLAWFRGDGPAWVKGPLVVSDTFEAAVAPQRHFYVQKVDTDPSVAGQTIGHAALETRLDYQPTADTSANPNAVYGTLWYNAPRTFTGDGAAVRGNAYTIAQTGAAPVNVSRLIGSYGRARHEAAGTVTDAVAIFADGAQNPGTGTITNAIGVDVLPVTTGSATNNYGIRFGGNFNGGSLYAKGGFDITLKTTGSSLTVSGSGGLALIGGALSAPSVTTSAPGSKLGTAAGSYTAPTNANTNVLFFNNGSSSWGGVGSDSSGNVYVASGLSAPKTKLMLTAADPANAETALYLLSHNSSGPSLQPVTLGGVDTGGSGFRVLRVPN